MSMRGFSKVEYYIPFFDEYEYVRKRCPRCGDFFWTQNPNQKLCGEATAKGCAEYTFLDNPPTERRYTYREIREKFLSFFEKRGHKRIRPYPIVARWRNDLYFTNASIIDFQPYVTEGMIPPPANPLVISQPCVRFLDVDNAGPTFGRHLTIFEMGGHHAFNYPDRKVYWKDETVRFHHEFVTKELGIKSEEVIYKEGIWSGGGNAGPDLESIVRGLELATLVFMKFKVINDDFIELPIRTVDTGYGIERYTWISQGSLSCFHAVYDEVLDKVMNLTGIENVDSKILKEVSKLSNLINVAKGTGSDYGWKILTERVGMKKEEIMNVLTPIVNVFTITDHTKCIAFLLSEGVIPSNVKEGYITRLMVRKTYRLLRSLSLEKYMNELVELQIDYWSRDFPHLDEMREEIIEVLNAELEKFRQTIARGGFLLQRIIRSLKRKGIKEMPPKTLIELYDSHGLPPEIVREIAAEEKIVVHIPQNFYSLVAERHMGEPREIERSPTIDISEKEISDLPETRRLYYEDPYIREFEAEVQRVLKGDLVVLDKTAFYPEGGGQPADHGHLEFEDLKCKVIDVQKVGRVILHKVDGPKPKTGCVVHGVIDWKRRSSLMRHHTATHLILGAARKVLGQHVWQAGAQKGTERSRLDISHYKRLTLNEIHRIEMLANEAVMRNMRVDIFWMPREEAEQKYGFRLYQGGVVPGREIRIVKSGEWDVEACGGTHCKSTGEVGLIKILHTERVQDGVERIIFAAGTSALKTVQQEESKLVSISKILNVPLERVDRAVENLVSESKMLRQDREKLMETLAVFMADKYMENARRIDDVNLIIRHVKDVKIDQLIKVANEIVKLDPNSVVALFQTEKNARVIVMVGSEALKK
ncbi:TPA: alanine--tRNA ligase, partial [Candidatus Bathyarchaeota archaeon]|nr:alanine--tRNA ligase [Candidatus Bathyarchaeota archaeon]